jgi:hypothetical protein
VGLKGNCILLTAADRFHAWVFVIKFLLWKQESFLEPPQIANTSLIGGLSKYFCSA